MRSRNFVLAFVFSLPLLGLLWLGLFELAARWPASQSFFYKDFLAREVTGPRIIIDAGSSASYGIDTDPLEAWAGRPVVNIADNGSVPLRHKVMRLEKIAQPGDIVILPLEWSHYFRDDSMSLEHVRGLFGGDRWYYYDLLPLAERVRIVFTQLPPAAARGLAADLHEARSEGRWRAFADEEMQRAWAVSWTGGRRGSIVLHGREAALEPEPACDKRVLTFYARQPWEMDDEFRLQLQHLGDLAARGVRVFLGFPTVAGEDCYASDEAAGLPAFVRELRALAARHGVGVLGDPYANRYPDRMLWNNRYHLNAEGQALATQRLLADLAAAGVEPPRDNAAGPALDARIRARLQALATGDTAQALARMAQQPAWDGRLLVRAQAGRQALPVRGWAYKGRKLATSGPASTLLLPLAGEVPAGARLCALFSPLGGPGEASVYVDGRRAGLLRDGRLDVPGAAATPGLLRLDLRNGRVGAFGEEQAMPEPARKKKGRKAKKPAKATPFARFMLEQLWLQPAGPACDFAAAAAAAAAAGDDAAAGPGGRKGKGRRREQPAADEAAGGVTPGAANP